MRKTIFVVLGTVLVASVAGLASVEFKSSAVARADASTPFEVGAFGCIVGRGGYRTVFPPDRRS